MLVGRLQQRTWTAEDGSARQVVEVLVEELGPEPAAAVLGRIVPAEDATLPRR